MARDGVANVVNRLRERGFDPHRLGPDFWESRCPVHHGSEYALAIIRDERGQVVIECRSEHCRESSVLWALDLTTDRLYAETPKWVLRKLNERPIVHPLYSASKAGECPTAQLASRTH